MKVAMIGTGYVGLVTGTCFAESGNSVMCVDIDADKVERLRRGEIPIYEPGLSELVLRNAKSGRLEFTTDYAEAVPDARCVFIAVGTPQNDHGAADLSGLWKVVETLAAHLHERSLVVIKSTVPVGTNRNVAERLLELTGRDVAVASNPEFLKEGAAIGDFTKPDRVVVGATKPEAVATLRELYSPFLRTEHPFLAMSLESAEMTKYVANCLLATKISFINEMANLCERVARTSTTCAVGSGTINGSGSRSCFRAWGTADSCFPKDVRELVHLADRHGMTAHVVRAVDAVNTAQKEILFQKVHAHFGGDLSGKIIAVWGQSFKPGTDDIREAPALVLIRKLLAAGTTVRVHDPAAMDNVRREFGDALAYCPHHYDTLDNADAAVIVTEWNEYRNPDFNYIKLKMKHAVIFDGRNLYDPPRMQELGIQYHGIGLGTCDSLQGQSEFSSQQGEGGRGWRAPPDPGGRR